MRQIRVAHLVTNLEIGGAESALERLVSCLDPLRFHCAVWSLKSLGEIGTRLKAAGIDVHVLGATTPYRLCAGFAKLRSSLRAYDPDLIQGWMYHGNLAALGVRRFLRRPVPVLWNIRGSLSGLHLERWATRMLIRLGGPLSRSVEKIVNNSRESVQAHVAIGYATERFVCIPNGFDTRRFCPDASARARFRQALSLRETDMVIGVIGRNHPVKGHKFFVEGFARAAARLPQLHAVLVGPGLDADNQSLRAAAVSAGVGDRLHLLGPTSNTEAVLAGLDLFCLPSLSEGFPNVLGEAMSCGLPCIATTVGDVPALCADTAFLVRPADPLAIADAIESLARLPAPERLAVGTVARQRIIDDFALAECTRRYEALYESAAHDVRG